MMAVHEELATQLNIWLADEGLIASQSTLEKPLVSKALGSWSRQELIDAVLAGQLAGRHPLGALAVRVDCPPGTCEFTPQETIKLLNLFAPIGWLSGKGQPAAGSRDRKSARPGRALALEIASTASGRGRL